MEEVKTNNVMRGALLLAMAGLISKVLSAVYRIPLQNLTGDIGFYIYQQLYPIIGTGMILALYGYPAAVSKLVAERKSERLPMSAASIYVPVMLILFGLNAVIAFLLYMGAPQLAEWAGDVELISAYRASSVIFLILPFLAGLRGFQQGQDQMFPTAVSQITEQLIRVTLIITGAYLISIGRLELYDMAYVGVFASILGMMAAVLGWGFFKKETREHVHIADKVKIPWKHYIHICFSLGVIAAMGHLILLLMQAVDVFTLVPGLLDGGMPVKEAKAMKGIFDRGQPLIQLGAVLGSSFALAIVPSAVKNTEQKTIAIREALQFSFYLAGAASIGLILLMPEINKLLFMDASGTESLRILMGAVFLTAVLITSASILQSMGHVNTVAGLVVAAVGLKWLLNSMLVPHFGITGSAVGTVVSLFALMILLIWLMNRKINDLLALKMIRFVPFITALAVMSSMVSLLKYNIHTEELSRPFLFFFVLGTVIIGAVVYTGVMLYCSVFSKTQIQALPFGHHLLSIYEFLDKKKRG